jgi:Flp pilus assembly protein TadD
LRLQRPVDHRIHPFDEQAAREHEFGRVEFRSRANWPAYDRNPKDPSVGMRYASVLTMGGRSSQALAVMQQVAIHNPTDRTVLAAYGKALAGGGQFDKALDAIRAGANARPARLAIAVRRGRHS